MRRLAKALLRSTSLGVVALAAIAAASSSCEPPVCSYRGGNDRVRATFDPGATRTFSIAVRFTPDDVERTARYAPELFVTLDRLDVTSEEPVLVAATLRRVDEPAGPPQRFELGPRTWLLPGELAVADAGVPEPAPEAGVPEDGGAAPDTLSSREELTFGGVMTTCAAESCLEELLLEVTASDGNPTSAVVSVQTHVGGWFVLSDDTPFTGCPTPPPPVEVTLDELAGEPPP